MPTKTICAIATAAAVIGASVPVHAAGSKAEFRVSYAGVPVATMTVTTRIDGNRYSVQGVGKTNRLTSVVARTKANFSSSGTIANGRIMPSAHNTVYKSRKKKGQVRLSFAKGNVVGASVNPPKKPKPDRVALKASHRIGVVDPGSTLLAVKAKNAKPSSICTGTVPVFDGNERYDVRLNYKRTQPYKGRSIIVCGARYEPIAGHRAKEEDVAKLRANRSIEVSYAPIPGTDAFALHGFSMRLGNATAKAVATSFSTN